MSGARDWRCLIGKQLHTLKPFLFVCMGHACVLGQEPSLVGDGFNESVCFLI